MQNTTKRAKKKARAGPRVTQVPVPPHNARRVIIPRPDVLHTYLEYNQINQYLEYIVHKYSNFVKLYTLGLTHERREVRALEINWNNPDNVELSSVMRLQAAKMADVHRSTGAKGPLVLPGDKNRNIIFIEAGTHAREWITVSTCLNCIYQLTERYTRNIEVLRNLRFIIVPLVNPDGYEYSRTKVGLLASPALSISFSILIHPYSPHRIVIGVRIAVHRNRPKLWAPTAIAITTYSGSADP